MELNIKDIALLKTNSKAYYRKYLKESKSYSHKPYLADLPYDRRSTNPEELQERIDEIDKRVDENKEKIELATREKDRFASLIEQQKEDIRKAEEENEKLKPIVGENFDKCRENIEDASMEWGDFMKEIEPAKENNDDYDADFENIYDVAEEVDKTLMFYGNFLYGFHDDMSLHDMAKECFEGNDIVRELSDTEYDMEWCLDESSEVTNSIISIDDAIDYARKIDNDLTTIDNNEFDIENWEKDIEIDEQTLKEYDEQIKKLNRENDDYKAEREKTEERKEKYSP